MTCRSARIGRRRQRGQGLLLLMLVMLVAGASVLMAGIGSRASIRAGDDTQTARALAIAKQALIAYAVTDHNRPGELPCPDANRDGLIEIGTDTAGSNCAVLRGWLPWQTLDLEDLRDGSGATLWYAVADAFHANGTTRINPDTSGGLTLDTTGATDIVAVIIAPGEARGGQTRPAAGAPDASSDVGQYLEDQNADADLGSYVTSGGANFNDRVVYVTTQELLRAVEQRVLGEVAVALRYYREVNGAFPWLSPFKDPFSSDPVIGNAVFDGVPGTRVGHLASIDASDSGTHTQDTGFTISWTAGDVSPTVVAAELEPLAPEAITPDPLVQVALDAVLAAMAVEAEQDLISGSETFPMPEAPTAGDPSSCTWQGDVSDADCQGTTPMQDAGYAIDILGLASSSVERQYQFDVAYKGASTPDTLYGARVRSVSSSSPFQNIDGAVPSTVTVKHIAILELLGAPFVRMTVTRRLDITDGSTATVNLEGIYVDAPSSGGAAAGELRLPAWFYANQWDHFVLVKYAADVLPGPGKSAPPAAVPCTPGPDCVYLDILNPAGGTTRVDAGAIVIGAGRQLPGKDRYPVAGVADADQFFEGLLNADVAPNPSQAEAERRVFSKQFNDQVRVVEPPPPSPPPPPLPPAPVLP